MTHVSLNQVHGTPHIDLTSTPRTSFVAMERYIGNMFISLISCHMKIIRIKGHTLEGIFTQVILNQAHGAPHIDLTSTPPTSFVAMERYTGKMFITLLSCHMKIIKNKKDILWKEF